MLYNREATMSFCYSILPMFIMLYNIHTYPRYIIERQQCCSVTQFYPYPLVFIIERQQCRSVTQFYPYPLCCIIERQQCRSVTQFYPYPICYIIERQQCRSVTQFFPYLLLYYREATVLFCHSTLPISICFIIERE